MNRLKKLSTAMALTICALTMATAAACLTACSANPASAYADEPAASARAATFPDVSDPEEWFYAPVYRSVELGLFKGYDDGTFGPMNDLTRGQFAVVLWRYLDPSVAGAYTGAANATGMPDVADNAFYTGAVNWAVSCGYITGYENGTFGPNDPITAEQMCVILQRTCKGSAADTSAVDALADATEVSSWAREGCAWALGNGVLSGYDNENGTRSLRPSETVYRARAAVILVNAIKAGVLVAEEPEPEPDPTPDPVPDPDPAPDPEPVIVDLKDAAVGNHVLFGTYEQDNDLTNGAEPIEWRVLDIQDGKAYLLSEYALDWQPYTTKYYEGGDDNHHTTWEKCTLRTWLNDDFYNAAFNSEEQSAIAVTHLTDEPNYWYPTVVASGDTDDKVFLLSLAEIEDPKYTEKLGVISQSYFTDDASRVCYETPYLTAKLNSKYRETSWWLRTQGQYSWSVTQVMDIGLPNVMGMPADGSLGSGAIRPAMWVTLPTE